MTEEDARKEDIPQEFLYPLLPSSRYLKTFIFTLSDWEELRTKGVECYLFLCHKRRDELPESVREYIKKGEGPDAQIRLRRRLGEDKGKPVSESSSSQTRRKHSSLFFDWYDLVPPHHVTSLSTAIARSSRRSVLAILSLNHFGRSLSSGLYLSSTRNTMALSFGPLTALPAAWMADHTAGIICP